MNKKIKLKRFFGGLIFAVCRYKQRKDLKFKSFLKKVHEAEQKAIVENKRYRIYSFRGKYRILSKADINFMRNRKIIPANIDPEKFCLYDTYTHSNLHPQFRDKDLNIEQYKLEKPSK